jgi:hypothetical protein
MYGSKKERTNKTGEKEKKLLLLLFAVRGD